ncbi:MAG: General secretory pathway protein E [Candidatus Nomurabacteria bacterium GW2011_GWA1_46_11]|uniref:General secretory pathway protein E n=1 Tax=Candidatus Nomurabacteria bacterium GW2011_GWA1_46_11 TaxID=1618732 RepID=A0A0G1NJ67_9BACT|nr:MAG: General secretory pathway protein E [Microgenomates group bacterium GW2011_GWB1_44_8]KKU20531.1 MAG: General secretory pathway protein E [Candidatus Nomurabacteria bacterium GW2011_GWA1_46_11]
MEILLSEKKISKEDYDQVKLSFVTTGKDAVRGLVEAGKITEEDVVQAKAKFYNVPFVKLIDLATSPVAMSQVDQVIAKRFQVMPLEYKPETKELSLAMANPVDLTAIEFIEKKSGVRVKPFAAMPKEVAEAIEKRYEQSLSTEVTAALKETGADATAEVKTVDIRRVGELIKEAPIAKIVTTILEFAMRSRSSDVHIEPLEGRTRVRYRIDGILHEKLVLPRRIHDALVSRIKILSDMKIDEKRIPQDGRFNFKTETEEVDLRVSTLPTVFGEKIVMRLLKKTGGVPTLQELGLRGRALKNLEEAILRPHGIILVTGPTGSGKTTTLYSVLARINTVKVNVVTVEDPVEYQIAGVNQVQINPAAGLTFASGLRSFLRQDPNVIMVGEVRDQETSDLAIQAALTGHLVFSTLHTNNASGALPRLLDMHAEPYLLASTITAVVGQRVARKICPTCKKPYAPEKQVVDDIKAILNKLWLTPEKVQLFKGEGCDDCGHSGYKGRVGIFEVLPVSEKIGRLILEHAPAQGIEKQAVEEGMITMKQDGYLKIVEGVTTIDEILRVAQE